MPNKFISGVGKVSDKIITEGPLEGLRYGQYVWLTTDPNFKQRDRERILTYTHKKFNKAARHAERLEGAMKYESYLYHTAGKFSGVRDYVIYRQKGHSFDGCCSVDEYTPSREALVNCVNSIAPYFNGMERLTFYAAISGNPREISNAKKILEKKYQQIPFKQSWGKIKKHCLNLNSVKTRSPSRNEETESNKRKPTRPPKKSLWGRIGEILVKPIF